MSTQQEIYQLDPPADIRAEVYLANILTNTEATESQFKVELSGNFERNIRRDILEAKNSEEGLSLLLSRAGLFDGLPEDFFHGPIEPINNEKASVDESENSTDYIRTFAAPFEEAKFRLLFDIARHEHKVLGNLFEWVELQNFWGFPKNISPFEQSVLILFLPIVHEIQVDTKRLEALLSLFTKESVILEIEAIECSLIPEENLQALGEMVIDCSSLGSPQLFIPQVTVLIGPIKSERLPELLPNGRLRNLLEWLYEFLFPFDYQIKTKVQVRMDDHRSELFTASEPESILNYTSIIN